MQPPAAVLAAFGATGVPVLESGGQGRTWRAGDLILKPCDQPAEAAWTCDLLSTLEPTACFRVARPVAARAGGWLASGWQAWHAVSGRPGTARCAEVLDLADALHAAIAAVPRPGFLDTRDDPWAYGDRVAWDELPVDGDGVMAELLLRLARARRPVRLPGQPVHGDLLGNVLFAEREPPAVIDWAIYFRPVLWAQAVAVVDALVWCGAPEEVVHARGDRDGWGQMLIRALMYRMATQEGHRLHGLPVRESPADYQAVVDLVLRYAS
jgi:uncharacterized protein (TIGR02569 family)